MTTQTLKNANGDSVTFRWEHRGCYVLLQDDCSLGRSFEILERALGRTRYRQYLDEGYKAGPIEYVPDLPRDNDQLNLW